MAREDLDGAIALKTQVVDEDALSAGQIETELSPAHLSRITRDVPVPEVPGVLRSIVGGGVTGRTRVVVRGGF